jgi:acyl-CoA reductase-like NAD-dependent aldehyde dehydrogenase
MATDLVLVARSVEQNFRALLRQKLPNASQQVVKTINTKSQIKIGALVSNAKEKGAKASTVDSKPHNSTTLLEDVTQDMDFWNAESFGPLLGLVVYDDEEEAVRIVNDSSFGLSAAIFSRNHLNALKIAKKLHTGAVHVNSATVHDEATLPHGGRKESGWGRFGAHWGFEEFLQTKTIILHP